LSLKDATAKLPDNLIVPLGQTLELGDLEVTPLRVERRKIKILTEGFEKPEPSRFDGLVLVLRLKNVSKQWAYVPLDNYFDRKWNPGEAGGSPPLTQLEAGPQRFYGGPVTWVPLIRTSKNTPPRREWVEGSRRVDARGVAQPLQPGQAEEFFVCTDAFDPDKAPAIARYLFGVDENNQAVERAYQGNFLWRVHLRRGVIDWKGRPKPATAVIGVTFTDRDCHQVG
jgi:hypothetical protein